MVSLVLPQPLASAPKKKAKAAAAGAGAFAAGSNKRASPSQGPDLRPSTLAASPKKKAKVQPAVGKGYKRCEQCQQVGGVALSRLTAP